MISTAAALKAALSGPVDVSKLLVEVYFVSAWIDITSYVEDASGTMEEVSSLTGGANANTLNLTLNNADGRFSPKNTAGPYFGNLLPNKAIRVSSVYGADSVRMFTGWVSNWIPNAKALNCQVTAEDTARLLKRKNIVEETIFNPLNLTGGYYLTTVLERAAWLSGLRWDAVTTSTDLSGLAWALASQTNPDGTTSAVTVTKVGGTATAVYTITTGGVTSTVMKLDLVSLALPCTPVTGLCLDQLSQIAGVVNGSLWFDAQGILVFRSRMYLNDTLLSSVQTFTVSSLDDVTIQANFEDSKYAQICNRATVKSTPWIFQTDPASGNVIETEVPFKGDLFAKYKFNAAEAYPDYTSATVADLYCTLPNNTRMVKTTGPTYPTAANVRITSQDSSDSGKVIYPPLGIVLFTGIEGVSITAGGSGYTGITVGFTGGGGSGAAATATITGGVLTGITITNSGTGYTSTPAVTLTPTVGGSGATATAIWENFPVFEQTRMKIALVNVAATAQQIQNISLVVKLMAPRQAITAIRSNAASITLYDTRDKAVTNNFIPTSAAAEQTAAWLVEDGRNPKEWVQIPVSYGAPWLELADRITVSETITNTIPVATDYIIRRIQWRWSLAVFAYAIEACTVSPSFSASALPATTVRIETSNQNIQGVQKGLLPPQGIDSTQQMVGMNNIPHFNDLLSNAKTFNFVAPNYSTAYATVFNGADLFTTCKGDAVTIDRGNIMQVSNSTGLQIQERSCYAAGGVGDPEKIVDLALGGGNLFAVGFNKKKIYVTNATTFGVPTIKADISANYEPDRAVCSGGRLYVLATTGSPNYYYRLLVWNAVTAVQQNVPDAVYDFKVGGFEFVQVGGSSNSNIAIDGTGRYLWIPMTGTSNGVSVNWVARFDMTSLVMVPNRVVVSFTSNILGSALHDGLSLWVAYRGATNSFLSQYKELNGATTLIGSDLDMGTDATYGPALSFDGTYIWVGIANKVLQITTNKQIVATMNSGVSNAYRMAFDGVNMWTPGGNGVTRITRVFALRQF